MPKDKKKSKDRQALERAQAARTSKPVEAHGNASIPGTPEYEKRMRRAERPPTRDYGLYGKQITGSFKDDLEAEASWDRQMARAPDIVAMRERTAARRRAVLADVIHREQQQKAREEAARSSLGSGPGVPQSKMWTPGEHVGRTSRQREREIDMSQLEAERLSEEINAPRRDAYWKNHDSEFDALIAEKRAETNRIQSMADMVNAGPSEEDEALLQEILRRNRGMK